MLLLRTATLQRKLRNRYEAGAYVPRSAAAGLPVSLAANGSRWVQNPLQGNQWQRIHTMVATHPGNNLWGISGIYYGTSTNAGMTSIYQVPQNKKIQGSDMGKGLYPGDEILIPGLPAPAGLGGGGVAPPALPSVPTGGLALPTEAPPGWPPGVPWPGAGTQPTPAPIPEPEPSLGLPTPPGLELPGGLPPTLPGVPGLTPAGQTAPAPAETKKEAFWTPTKIGVAAVGGVAVVGVVLALVMRKPGRRR